MERASRERGSFLNTLKPAAYCHNRVMPAHASTGSVKQCGCDTMSAWRLHTVMNIGSR